MRTRCLASARSGALHIVNCAKPLYGAGIEAPAARKSAARGCPDARGRCPASGPRPRAGGSMRADKGEA